MTSQSFVWRDYVAEDIIEFYLFLLCWWLFFNFSWWIILGSDVWRNMLAL